VFYSANFSEWLMVMGVTYCMGDFCQSKFELQNGRLLKIYLMAKVPPNLVVCGIDADQWPASLLGGTDFTESSSYFLAVLHVSRLPKVINLCITTICYVHIH